MSAMLTREGVLMCVRILLAVSSAHVFRDLNFKKTLEIAVVSFFSGTEVMQ